jgi:hypothetical protein
VCLDPKTYEKIVYFDYNASEESTPKPKMFPFSIYSDSNNRKKRSKSRRLKKRSKKIRPKDYEIGPTHNQIAEKCNCQPNTNINFFNAMLNDDEDYYDFQHSGDPQNFEQGW